MKFSQRLALSYIRTKFRVLSKISKKKAAEKAFELFCTPLRRNKNELPKIFLEAESLSFELEGIKIIGWRWNHPGKRKLLILHGFESSVTSFDRYIRPFIRKGYEVLAFDAPAHGRSAGKKITAPLYKKMILEINRRYGPIESFIAHSFGGLVLSLALEEMPHNYETRIALIAPATETTSAIDSFFKFLKLDPAIRPEFDDVIKRTGGLEPAWYSISRAMRNNKADVLWFHDEEDDTTPLSDVEKVMEENHPHIKFVITKGLGHRRIYRDNQVSKAIQEFL